MAVDRIPPARPHLPGGGDRQGQDTAGPPAEEARIKKPEDLGTLAERALDGGLPLRSLAFDRIAVDSEEAARAVAVLLALPALQEAEFQDCMITNDGGEALLHLLAAHASCPAQLAFLSCEWEDDVQVAGRLLVDLTQRRTLQSFTWVDSPAASVQPLLDALAANDSQIERLALVQLDYGAEQDSQGVRRGFQESVARMLETTRSLRDLNLSVNRLGDDALDLLWQALARNVTLRTLDLRDNCWSGASIDRFVSGLDRNDGLWEVQLDLDPTDPRSADQRQALARWARRKRPCDMAYTHRFLEAAALSCGRRIGLYDLGPRIYAELEGLSDAADWRRSGGRGVLASVEARGHAAAVEARSKEYRKQIARLLKKQDWDGIRELCNDLRRARVALLQADMKILTDKAAERGCLISFQQALEAAGMASGIGPEQDPRQAPNRDVTGVD